MSTIPPPDQPSPDQPWNQPPAGSQPPNQPWNQPPAGSQPPNQPWNQPPPGGQPPNQPWNQPPDQPWGAGPPGQPTDEDRTWGAVAHAGSFVAAWIALGILGPLAVLLLRGNRSPYVRHHAVESLNFQINALVWFALAFLLIFVLVGFALIFVVGAWYLVFVVLASVAASRGEWYRYPFIFRMIR